MLVEVAVAVLRRNVLLQDVGVDFYHVGFVGADGGEVAAFFAAFRVGEEGCWEKRSQRRSGEENGAAGADGGFEEAVIFAVGGGEDLDFGARERGRGLWVPVCGDEGRVHVELGGLLVWAVQALEEVVNAFEVAVDDVEVVNIRAAQEQGESDVPVGLLACAEDDDVVDVVPFLKQHGACEGGAEGGDFFGVD